MGHFHEMNYRFEHEPLLSHLIVLTTKLFQSDFCVCVFHRKRCLNMQFVYRCTQMHTVVFCSVVRYNRKYSSNLNNAFIQISMNMIFFFYWSSSIKSGKLANFSLALTKHNTTKQKTQTASMVQSPLVQSVLCQAKPACWLVTVFLFLA